MRRQAFFIGFLFFLLSVETGCKSTFQLEGHSASVFTLDTTITADNLVSDIIAPYRMNMEGEMKEVLVQIEHDLKKDKPESTLGNVVADAILTIGTDKLGRPADFSVVNFGGIRLPGITKGALTKGKVFELMPFDNQLVALTLDSTLVAKLFIHITNEGGWPISGAKIFVKKDGELSTTIGDKKLTSNKMYTLIISDYLADGGDKLFFLKSLPRKDLSVLFRDALMEYFQTKGNNNQGIRAEIEGRIVYE